MMLQMKFEIANYTADTFLPYIGQVLRFVPGDVQLELLEVKRHSSNGRPAGFREPFALLFALRGEDQLGRGLHRIAHDDFEPADWFLTRVLAPGRDPRLAYYEAVFG
jgi:uncharacterized protein DUF6916